MTEKTLTPIKLQLKYIDEKPVFVDRDGNVYMLDNMHSHNLEEYNNGNFKRAVIIIGIK